MNAFQTTTAQANKPSTSDGEQAGLSHQNHLHAADSGRAGRGGIGCRTGGKATLGMAARDGINSAKERPSDPVELLLAEIWAVRFALLSLFHAGAQATVEGKPLLPESVLNIRDRGRRQEARTGPPDARRFPQPTNRRERNSAMNRRRILLILARLLAFAAVAEALAMWILLALVVDAHRTPLPACVHPVFTAGHHARDRRGPVDLEERAAPKKGTRYG